MNKKNIRLRIRAGAAAGCPCACPWRAQDNPFLSPYKTPFQTPPFDRIQIGHYLPAVQEGIKRQQAEIDAIVANPKAPTFENTIVALDMSGHLARRCERRLLLAAERGNQPPMQDLANELAPLLSAHSDNISLNGKLFARVKAVYDQRAKLKLDCRCSATCWRTPTAVSCAAAPCWTRSRKPACARSTRSSRCWR